MHSVSQTNKASPSFRNLCNCYFFCLECSFPNCSCDWLFLMVQISLQMSLNQKCLHTLNLTHIAFLCHNPSYHSVLSSFYHLSLSEIAYLTGINSVSINYRYNCKENMYVYSSRTAENIHYKRIYFIVKYLEHFGEHLFLSFAHHVPLSLCSVVSHYLPAPASFEQFCLGSSLLTI